MVRLYLTLAAIPILGLVWFLTVGHARGETKRAVFRLALLGTVASLFAAAFRRGLFLRSTVGFQVVLGLAVLGVVFGYLYTVRFCPECGRIHRGLRDRKCRRCQRPLPRHGMTRALWPQ